MFVHCHINFLQYHKLFIYYIENERDFEFLKIQIFKNNLNVLSFIMPIQSDRDCIMDYVCFH